MSQFFTVFPLGIRVQLLILKYTSELTKYQTLKLFQTRLKNYIMRSVKNV